MDLYIVFLTFIIHIVNGQWNTKDFFKREHSLLKPYQAGGTSIPYWDILGSTIVTSNYIRLTSDKQSLQGSLWNTIPCSTRHWEIQVHFKVHGNGKDLFGDGMAIWYSKNILKPGPVFGNENFFQGLAILVDTYSNHNGEHNVKIYTDLENKAAWKECFSVKGIRLPTGYHFGMSAATGELSDNHDIIGVRTYELSSDVRDNEDRANIIPSAASFEPPREHVDDPKSSWSGIKLFFMFLFGTVAIIACAIVGIVLYQNHKEKSRKRFY